MFCKVLTVCAMCVSIAVVGCSQNATSSEPCATVTIEGTGSNNNFTSMTANQCNLVIEDGMLELDILDRSTGQLNPRVIFTFAATSEPDLVVAPINLDRTGLDLSVQVAPAVYQEWDESSDSGSFWSSSSGTISFTQLADGTITGEFNFTADNPPSTDTNDATGEVTVSGTVTIPGESSSTSTDGACGMSSASMMTAMLLSLSMVSLRRRFKRST